ncbi:MAG: proline dehydrogenase family protein [Calditrichaceae bacterium]|nr:proline dehydrogenase family protein [Calditrichaceae bacterium]MBN2707839.1 proline dehydrogenase family protein [Calditrichaceae bacterium]RQV94905.1 MAG: proline dehydrogenase [Calditrichota bacterium]
MSLLDKLVVMGLPFVPKPVVGFFSKRYIAGPNLEDAVRVVKQLNSEGIMATLDLLGEEVKDKKISIEATEEYKRMLKVISKEKLDSNVSVKPTHMGLNLDAEFCYENIKSIIETAKSYNNFVRIDMEDHTTTDATINMYLKLKNDYEGYVGTALQAYMRRTSDDVNQLSKYNANLRLCKGIYNEPREIAYKDMEIINANYKHSLEKLLRNKCYVGIATHDEILVWHALKVIEDLMLNREQYEFQMLLGVDEQLRTIIVDAGHRLRVYVPYGKDWYGYSTRRLKENPRMAGMIFKKIFHLK